LEVRTPSPVERANVLAGIESIWGPVVVTRERLHVLAELEVLVAATDRLVVGALTFRQVSQEELEIVTVNAFVLRQGVGNRLLQAAASLAPRVWLVTTNDNIPAQRLYESLGARLEAIHKGAVNLARKLKPSIPLVGNNGIAIEDELVYAWGRSAG